MVMDRSSLSVNDEDKNSLVPNFFLFDLFYPNNSSPSPREVCPFDALLRQFRTPLWSPPRETPPIVKAPSHTRRLKPNSTKPATIWIFVLDPFSDVSTHPRQPSTRALLGIPLSRTA
ncbi:hypothetical protein NW767_008005 [Fusarium falciforme]|nr:hypothetical protein NW767_008005 [Fusarium falciforme]KAJ4246653.1 hypothetical protein NW757_009244 [Fusarium falciforme]